jgi:hypothetical protein
MELGAGCVDERGITVRIWGRSRAGEPPDVTLFSRPGCHLCEDAEAQVRQVLGRAQSRLRVVNILEDRDLEDRYVFRVPVLCVNGVEVAEGQITVRDVRRALKASVVTGGSG